MEEFLLFSHLVPGDEAMLRDWSELDSDFSLNLPEEDPSWTLAQFIDFVLQFCGSPFTVGEVEEDATPKKIFYPVAKELDRPWIPECHHRCNSSVPENLECCIWATPCSSTPSESTPVFESAPEPTLVLESAPEPVPVYESDPAHVPATEVPASAVVPPEVAVSSPALPEVAASAAEPPESAVSISAPLMQVVPTFQVSVCPATTTEFAHELPTCPVTVKETVCELSDCPVMANEAICEHADCSVTAKEAVYKLWTFCPVMAAEAVINLSVLFVPVLPDPPWWFPVPSALLKWSSAPPWHSSAPPSLLWWSSAQPWDLLTRLLRPGFLLCLSLQALHMDLALRPSPCSASTPLHHSPGLCLWSVWKLLLRRGAMSQSCLCFLRRFSSTFSL